MARVITRGNFVKFKKQRVVGSCEADEQARKIHERFIEISPLLVLSRTGPDGLGLITSRGEEPEFVHILSDNTVAVPNRSGIIGSIRSPAC